MYKSIIIRLASDIYSIVHIVTIITLTLFCSMWSVICSRFFSWTQCTGRELRHRTTITSVYIMLIFLVVVGGDDDVAAYQYIIHSETFILHNMKHSSLTSSLGFHSLTFTYPVSSSNATEYISFPWSWVSHTVLRMNITTSSVRLRPYSTSRNFALNCMYSKCAWHVSFFVILKHWLTYDVIDNLLTIIWWTIN